MNTYPNDDDGKVLKFMAESGIDMTASIEIEFPIDSKDEETSEKIGEKLKQNGYGNIEIDFDEGELKKGEKMTAENEEFWPSWTVYTTFNMIPKYDQIIKIQKDLNALVIPLGGKSDGWGLTQ